MEQLLGGFYQKFGFYFNLISLCVPSIIGYLLVMGSLLEKKYGMHISAFYSRKER